MNAEQIWTAARDRNGDTRDRRVPPAGIRAVLLALADGPAHGGEIARRVTSAPDVARALPKLWAFGFIDCDEQPGLGHQGGGRSARVWRLTRAGRELVEALLLEQSDGVTA